MSTAIFHLKNDLIGVVKGVQVPTVVSKNGMNYNVFNFDIECKSKILLPVVVWDDDIARIKPFITINNIIYLDAIFAKPQTFCRFTNVRDFILTCRSYTLVNIIGRIKTNDMLTVNEYKKFNNINEAIQNISSYDQKVGLNLIIKSDFRKENARSYKRIGTLTDGLTKITTFINDYQSNIIFTKGEHVQVIGKFIESSKQICFEIMSSVDDMKKISKENVSGIVLDKIHKTPKRKQLVIESTENQKLKVQRVINFNEEDEADAEKE